MSEDSLEMWFRLTTCATAAAIFFYLLRYLAMGQLLLLLGYFCDDKTTSLELFAILLCDSGIKEEVSLHCL